MQNGPKMSQKNYMQRGFWTKMQKPSVIHVKIENLMSDKRLSWMCFQDDFGLVLEVHFEGGCLTR